MLFVLNTVVHSSRRSSYIPGMKVILIEHFYLFNNDMGTIKFNVHNSLSVLTLDPQHYSLHFYLIAAVKDKRIHTTIRYVIQNK